VSPARRRSAGLRLKAAAALAMTALAGFAQTAGPPALWTNAPERFVLATGIPCLYQKDVSSPTTVVGLFIGGGRSAVPPGLDGLASISTRLLLEIPDEGMVQALMAQATRLSYVCLEDHAIVVVECLSEHLEDAIRVAAKIIQDPLLSGLRVGRAKDLMKAYGRMDDDDPVAAGRNAVFAALFGGQGYGSLPYGTAASLSTIGRKDVAAFVRRSVVKPNVFFGVQSDLDAGPVRGLLEKYFDGIPDGAPPEIAAQAAVLPEGRELIVHKDTQQSSVGQAYALPRRGLADMAKAVLLETLLGKGPGSRLWSLRVDDRLAYSVDADLAWTRTGGVLIAHLETGKARVPEAAAALGRVLDGLRERGLAEGELEAVRAQVRGRFLRSTEAKAARLRTLGLYRTLGLGTAGLPDLLAAVEAVMPQEMEAYLREALDPSRALKVTVGPGPEASPSRPSLSGTPR
jgi:zinc protease